MHTASRITFLMSLYTMMFGMSGHCLAAGTKGEIGMQFASEIELSISNNTLNKIPPFSFFGNEDDTDEQYGAVYFRAGLGSGEFKQDIAAGETLVINDAEQDIPVGSFSGPATLEAKIDFNTSHFGVREHWRQGQSFTVFVGGGGSILDVDIKMTDGIQTYKFNDRSLCVAGSVGGIYHYNDWIDIEGEGFLTLPAKNAFAMLFGEPDYVSSLTDARVRILIKQNKWLQYYVGYRLMKYSYTDYNITNDPAAVRLDLSGAYGGLSLRF